MSTMQVAPMMRSYTETKQTSCTLVSAASRRCRSRAMASLWLARGCISGLDGVGLLGTTTAAAKPVRTVFPPKQRFSRGMTNASVC